MVTRSVKTEVASAKSSYKSPELDRTSQRKMRKGANTELDSAALPDSPILTRKRKVETDEEPQSPPIKGKAKKSGKRGGDGDMEVVEVGCGDGTTEGQIAGRTRLVKFTRRLTQSPDNTKSSEPTDSCYTCNGDEKGKSSQEQKLEVSPKNDEKKGRIVKKETSQAGKKIPGKAKGAASPSASQAPKRKLADDDNEVTFPKMSKMLQDKDRSSVAAETKLKVDTKSGKEVKQPRTTGAQPVAKSVSGKEVGRVVVSSKGQPVLKGVRKILPKPTVVAPVVEVLKLGMDSTRTAPIQAENPREASMSTTPPVINSEDDGQQGVKKSDEFMQCPGCNLLFTSTLSLAAHRRYRCPVRLSDDQLGAFICLCGLGFATKEELEKHNVTEREIGRHPRSEKNRCRMICNCLDCGQPFHRSQLSSHKRECTKLMNVYTRTFWCKHCTAFKTTSALQMKRHVAAYHPDAPEEDHTLFKSDTELEKMDEKGAPPKMCLDCGETFLGAAFKAHKRDGCSMEGSSKVYSCFECHKMFNTRKELDEHKKTLHTVSGAFVCGFCHETFNVYVDLRQHHEKVHSKTAKVPPKVISDLLQNLKKGSCEPPQMTYPSGAAPQVSMSSSADAKGMNIMVGDEGNGFEISIDTSNPAGPAVRVNKKQVLDMPAAKEVAPLKSAAELTECELDTLKKLKSSLEQEKKHKPAILRRKSTSKRGMKSKELIEPTLVKGPVKNIRMQGPGAANADSSRSSQGFVSIPSLPGVRMLVPVGKDKMVCLQCQCTLDSVTDIASHKCPSSGRKMMVKAEAAASPEKKDWSMKPLPLAKAKKGAKTGEEGQEDDEEVEWFEATTN